MLKRLLAYILIILGILVMLFFRKYTGTLIPYPFVFQLTGFVLFIGGIYLLRYSPTPQVKKRQQQITDAINDLRLNGEKITVDFALCEIKEHSYREEREEPNDKKEWLSLVAGGGIESYAALAANKLEQVQVTQSIIIFSHQNTRSGETERFISRVIPKDSVTLSFYLDQQKSTTLYVDKVNRSKFYFDLDFLEEKK